MAVSCSDCTVVRHLIYTVRSWECGCIYSVAVCHCICTVILAGLCCILFYRLGRGQGGLRLCLRSYRVNTEEGKTSSSLTPQPMYFTL